MTLYAIAQATNILVKTRATVIPGYQVMARLPNDELVINIMARLPNDAALVLNVLPPKYNKKLAKYNLNNSPCSPGLLR
jgi:hypothetical protein